MADQQGSFSNAKELRSFLESKAGGRARRQKTGEKAVVAPFVANALPSESSQSVSKRPSSRGQDLFLIAAICLVFMGAVLGGSYFFLQGYKPKTSTGDFPSLSSTSKPDAAKDRPLLRAENSALELKVSDSVLYSQKDEPKKTSSQAGPTGRNQIQVETFNGAKLVSRVQKDKLFGPSGVQTISGPTVSSFSGSSSGSDTKTGSKMPIEVLNRLAKEYASELN